MQSSTPAHPASPKAQGECEVRQIMEASRADPRR